MARFAHPALWTAVAAVALYLPAIGYGFVRDDHHLVERNPFLQRAGYLGQLLVSDFWSSTGTTSGLWRPLVLFSYWLDGRIGDWTPPIFHLANAFAHGAASALVALLLTQGGAVRIAALLGGLWFAAAPLHLESVAWISGRTDVYCAVFFLLALWLDRRARGAGRSWPGVLPLTSLGLALLAKEAAVPFVLVAAVLDRVERPAPWRAGLRWVLPYAVVTGLYLVSHALLSPTPTSAIPNDAALEARRQWSAWTMLPLYLSFLAPWGAHSAERMLAVPISPWAPPVLIGALLQVIAAAGLAIAAWRRSRWAPPLALFWLTLLPPIVAAGALGIVTFAERLLYLPSAGAAWALGLLVARVSAAAEAPRAIRRIAPVAASMLVIAGAIVTLRVLPTWKDDATMFEAMVIAQPDDPKARVGWAEALIDRDQEAGALRELAIAERLDPRLPEIHVSRAAIHFRRGEWERVLDRARRALAIDPKRVEARLLEATALLRLRRVAPALAVVERLADDRPGDPDVESLWGQVLLVAGRPEEALGHLQSAAAWSPDDPGLAFALGQANLLSGRAREAREAFGRTVVLDPGYYDGWLRLATACAASGDAAGKERALAAAAALPEASDGRVEALRHQLR